MSKVFIHDDFYKRITVEIPFDKETVEKLRDLNVTEGYVIEHVKMDYNAEGVVLQLERLVQEEGDDERRCKSCYNGLSDDEDEQCNECKENNE